MKYTKKRQRKEMPRNQNARHSVVDTTTRSKDPQLFMNREAISKEANSLPSLPDRHLTTLGDLSEPKSRVQLARVIFDHIATNKSTTLNLRVLTLDECEKTVEFTWDMMEFSKSRFNLKLTPTRFCDVCLRVIYCALVRSSCR
jgi:hypothetical protein